MKIFGIYTQTKVFLKVIFTLLINHMFILILYENIRINFI